MQSVIRRPPERRAARSPIARPSCSSRLAATFSKVVDALLAVAHSSAESTHGAARSRALLASVVVGERYCSWIASIASHNSFGSVSKRNASRHSSTCFGDVVPVITPALYQRSRAQLMASSVGVMPHASASFAYSRVASTARGPL